MKLELSDALLDDAKGLISHLTLASMKANYPEFMRVYDDAEKADAAMSRVYGKAVWDDHCEYIWQWYDMDYCDE